MSVFNINDYKEVTNIDLDELDDRYVNEEGDAIEHLNISTIQMYDHSTIAFGDSTVQTTAFNEDVVRIMVDQYNNSKTTYNFNDKPLTAVQNITFTDGTLQSTAYIKTSNNSVVGLSQIGRFYDSPLRGQGGGQPVEWWISSPDLNSVNANYHADILETGTSYATGKNYYFKFKSIGTYRLQMAWSITRNYVSTGQAMGWPSPPPYYPNPNFSLPNYGGSGGSSGSSGSTVTQFTGAVYYVKLTNTVNVTNVIAENFPKSIYNIVGQTFTGTDGLIPATVSAVVDLHPSQGQTYSFKGLNVTSSVSTRPNRFYLDITFTINNGDPLDLYTHIKGSVPSNTTNPYYFNVNTHTYTITRLA